jgi:hypothetical protein
MQGRATATVACGVGGACVVPFLHEWSILILRGNHTCSGKVVATPTVACSRERALLAHVRLREQGVQVGARR